MAKRGPKPGTPRPKRIAETTGLLGEYVKHLVESGKSQGTVYTYLYSVRPFLKFIGGEAQLPHISEQTISQYFKQMPKAPNKHIFSVLNRFLRFYAHSLPVKLALPSTSKELATLRSAWNREKRKLAKDAADDLIAKLGKKVIDDYLFFNGRLEGKPESIEELQRLAEECEELIQTNLSLFLSLSAQGRNLGSLIDERIQK
jgi:hypothetical protein